MTSTDSKTSERKATDFPKVPGTGRRTVAVVELRELGMWIKTGRFTGYGWGLDSDQVHLAGAGKVGQIVRPDECAHYAEVEEWAIEAALKLDLATNVKLAVEAQAAHRIAASFEVN